MAASGLFASSLRSLIAPWARSPGARYPRSPARCPRPVAPPPLPRRHSDPTATTNINNPQKKFRRYSDIRNPKQEIDLRQELLTLDLNNREVNRWLGTEFEEKDEDVHSIDSEVEIDFRFNHDIPLQRSISLDRGIEIFNYLQTLSSEESESDTASSWTMHSEERQNRLIEMQRSFEDIPASPYKAKSRRASLAVHNETYAQSLALFVLKESYKGMEDIGSGNPAIQIKKLQKTFSFKNFDDIKESGKSSVEDLREYGNDTGEPQLRIRIPIGRNDMSSESINESGLLSPLKDRQNTTFTFTTYDDVRDSDKSSMENLDEIGDSYERRPPMRRRYNRSMGMNSGNLLTPFRKPAFSFKSYDDVREFDKSSVENLEDVGGSDIPNFKNNVPTTKTISFEDQKDRPVDRKVETKGPRQRRVGIIASPPPQNLLEIREEVNKKSDLRKEILIQQNLSHVKSCEELITRKKGKVPRSGSVETVLEPVPSTSGMKRGKDQSNISSNIRKLKKNFTSRLTEAKERILPTIVISDVDSPIVENIVVKDENVTPTIASNLVKLSSTCDCRICSEDEVYDGMSFLRRNLKNLFIKIVSCRDYGKKLTYWDENNSLDEHEMYNSVMHVLKLMLGLWLRHVDHN